MNKKLNSQNTASDIDQSKSYRLPCRGCTINCSNYKICNGKPWRLPANSQLIKGENK